MNAEQEIERLLRENRAVLKRDTPHLVYEFPNGRKFTMSKTPSDWRAAHKALAVLRGVLGFTGNDGRGTPGERRAKKVKNGAAPSNGHTRTPDAGGGLAAQLRTVGVVEDALRAELNEANLEIVALRSALSETERRVRWAGLWKEAAKSYRRAYELGQRACPCWWCFVVDVARETWRQLIGMPRPDTGRV